MQSKTDRELIECYATDSNDAAFAELVARYSPMVYRACLRVLGNANDAEDATQAAFLVLARKAGSLRQEGRLNGWLHRVARQVALQALRVRADRERRQEQLVVSQERMTADASEADTEAVFKAVDAELDGLSAILREAVVLRYLRGFSEQEAAAQAGCAVSAMKWRTSDGIAKLRARLSKRGVALGATALAGLLTSEASAAVPETLLPSILAVVKTAAAIGAAATTTTTTAAMLAKGAMKAMFIAKVKMVAAIAAAVVVTGTAVPVGIAVAQAVGKEGKEGTATAAIQADLAKPAAQTGASVVNLKLVAITESPGGTNVWFVDVGAVPSRSFMLRVGESFDGYTLVSADYEKEIVMIERDGVVTTLRMNERAISTNHVVAQRFDPSIPQTSLSYEERIRQRRRDELRRRGGTNTASVVDEAKAMYLLAAEQLSPGPDYEVSLTVGDFKVLDQFEAHALGQADKHFAKKEPKEYELAAAAYDAFVLKYPKSKAVPYALVRQGRSLQFVGKRSEAIKIYGDVLDYYPDSISYAAPALLYLAQCRYLDGNIEEATKAIAELRADKDYGKHEAAACATFLLAHMQMAGGKTDEAIATLGTIGASFPAYAALAQLRQAEVYEKAGKTAEAVAAYQATITKYPETFEAAHARSALDKMGNRTPDGGAQVDP